MRMTLTTALKEKIQAELEYFDGDSAEKHFRALSDQINQRREELAKIIDEAPSDRGEKWSTELGGQITQLSAELTLLLAERAAYVNDWLFRAALR